MSLFKAREWWSVKCGENETFQTNHMCIAKCNKTAKQFIVVASVEGYLRIYDPTLSSNNYTYLILETKLNDNIIGVESGRFTNATGIRLAVLHPKKLSIFTVDVQEGSKIPIKILLEHNLAAHAFSLTMGPFGRLMNEDHLCVQSLDGTLSFFEHERVGICCQLPNFLLPSPICYLKSTDAFVVCDAAWTLHTYKYQTFANGSDPNVRDDSASKLISDWQFHLGEQLIEVKTDSNDRQNIVVVLTEKNLHCIKDSGLLLWSKRLDYHPICCTLQPSPMQGSFVILVCSDASTLLVYKDSSLQWNCKLPFAPLVIQVAKFQSIEGLLVILSASGDVNISYMGTQMVQYGFSLPHRGLDRQHCLKEIPRLKQLINNPSSKSNVFEDVNTVVDLQLDTRIMENYVPTENEAVDTVNGCVRIILTRHPNTELRLTISCGYPIAVSPTGTCCLLDGRGEMSLPVQFYIPARHWNQTVDSLIVDVTAVVLSSEGFSIRKSFVLPLTLAMNLTTPVREALIKITLTTNQPTVDLSHLFLDFQADSSSPNAVALEHLNKSKITILASKSASKYRLQADTLAALALPICELERRLLIQSNDSIQVLFDGPLPVQELWSQVENHYEMYAMLKDATEKLSQAVLQFEIFQMEFHSQVLNTGSSDVIDTFSVLQLAYDLVMENIQQLEKLEEAFGAFTQNLQSSINCILTLIGKSTQSKVESIQLLAKALFPVKQSDNEQCWQKVAGIRLNFLMKRWSTPIGRQTDSEIFSAVANKTFDMAYFRKSLLQAFDMVSKGQ